MRDAEPVTIDDPADVDTSYRRRLLLTVMLAVMGFGSLMTIVTVSLSVIAKDLGSSRTTLGWIVTGLMLTMAVLTPLGGKLGDIRGHRKMFLIGLAGSVVTTALAAVAWNAASLIGFRVLFGMSGALVQPNAMALMMAAYGPKRRATAMGWFQFATTGAPTIGLVVGGPMVDVIGWRGIFWVFAAVSVVALAAAFVVLRESDLRDPVPLDIVGSMSLGATILLALLAVTRGVANGVDDVPTLLMAAGSVLALWIFIRTERRAPFPLLKLAYFRRASFTAPLAANALNQFAYMGGFVVTPLLLSDNIYGYAVGTIALAMAPRPGAFAISAPVGGWVATRIGEGLPMLMSSAMMVASMVSFAAGSRPGAILFVLLGLVLSGTAAGIGAPSYTSLVVRSVDPGDVGVATGMNQTMLFVGIVSGIQIMLVVLGDNPSQARYAGTFLAGAAIAGLGLVASAIAAASVNRRTASAASELPAVLAVTPSPGAEQGVSA